MADMTLQENTPEGEETGEQQEHAAWWLATRRRRSEWQSLVATGAATFSGRPRSHFQAVRPGDPVLMYVSKPDHAIRAVGVVTRATNDERRTTNDDQQSSLES